MFLQRQVCGFQTQPCTAGHCQQGSLHGRAGLREWQAGRLAGGASGPTLVDCRRQSSLLVGVSLVGGSLSLCGRGARHAVCPWLPGVGALCVFPPLPVLQRLVQHHPLLQSGSPWWGTLPQGRTHNPQNCGLLSVSSNLFSVQSVFLFNGLKDNVLLTTLLPFIRGLCSQHNEFILLISQKFMSSFRSDLEDILKLYINGKFLLEFSFSMLAEGTGVLKVSPPPTPSRALCSEQAPCPPLTPAVEAPW